MNIPKHLKAKGKKDIAKAAALLAPKIQEINNFIWN